MPETDQLADQINALQRLPTSDLLDRYAALYGERSATRNRLWLLRKVAWRMQAQAHGGLSERARLRASTSRPSGTDCRSAGPRSTCRSSPEGCTTSWPRTRRS